MNLLEKLEKQYKKNSKKEKKESPSVKITQNGEQYYVKFEGYSFVTPINIPSKEYLEETIEKLVGNCSPIKIKGYLAEKWGASHKKGVRFEKYAKDGKYIGDYSYVDFRIINTQNPFKSRLICYVPWYGNISLTPFDNRVYDSNKLISIVKTLFYHDGILYVPKLDDKKYKKLSNHYFVEYFGLSEFKELVERKGLTYDITIKKTYTQEKYLRDELNKALRKNTSLEMENKKLQSCIGKYKSRINDLEHDIEDITSLELEKIKKEKQSSRKNSSKGYHYLGDGIAQHFNRKPGFYKLQSFKPRRYAKRGIQTNDPIPYLLALNLYVNGASQKQILKELPELFNGHSNRYAPLSKMLRSYDKGLFENAIDFIVRNYDIDSSFINLKSFRRVNTL